MLNDDSTKHKRLQRATAGDQTIGPHRQWFAITGDGEDLPGGQARATMRYVADSSQCFLTTGQGTAVCDDSVHLFCCNVYHISAVPLARHGATF